MKQRTINKRKIKVAFVSSLDLNLYRFRLSWIKVLMQNEYKIYVIIPKGEYTEEFIREGVNVIHYSIERGGLNPFKDILVILNLYKIFKKNKFNIVHSFTIKPNIYASIAGKLAGIPIIINTITGLGYVYTVNSSKNNFLRVLINFFYKISFRLAKAIIFQNSEDTKIFRNIENKKVIIEGSGIDTDYFSLKNINLNKMVELRNELKINDENLVITMISRLCWSKGIKEFVQAANNLIRNNVNLRFFIIGWIDKGNPDSISESYIETSSKEYICFLGKRDDIKDILILTDIFVLPSYYREGLPRSILEAMAMEKPIITTDNIGCKDAVKNAVNGILVPKRDVEQLSAAINLLIQEENLRHKMGIASRRIVENKFSDVVVTEKVIKLYKMMVSSYYKKRPRNDFY